MKIEENVFSTIFYHAVRRNFWPVRLPDGRLFIIIGKFCRSLTTHVPKHEEEKATTRANFS